VNLRSAFVLCSIGWFALLLAWISDLGIGFPGICLALTGTFAIVVVAFVSMLAGRAPGQRLASLLWLSPLVLGMVACGAIYVDSQSVRNPLFQLRFALSRPQLDAFAAAPVPSTARMGWIGLFRFDQVILDDSGLRLMTFGCGLIDQCGLAHLPGPAPTSRGKNHYQHLAGPWYFSYEVF